MARYVYNQSGVNSTIAELNDSINEIDNVNTIINSGISIIESARGGQYIEINSAAALQYKDVVETAVRKLISDIRSKVALIEEYNSASFLEKAFSTVGMGLSKLIEGFGTAGENILDGFCSLGGLVVGIFSEDAKNSIGQFVQKDHVGDFFKDAYNGGFLTSIEKYSAFSSESTAANIFKGVGIAAGYVATAYATGGVMSLATGGSFATGAAAAANSIGYNMAFAGIGGMGSGTEDALQSGMNFDQAAFQGAKRGAIQAGTVFLAGKASEKLSNVLANRAAAKAAANSADDFVTVPGEVINPSTTTDVLDKFGNIISSRDKYGNVIYSLGDDAMNVSATASNSTLNLSAGNAPLGLPSGTSNTATLGLTPSSTTNVNLSLAPKTSTTGLSLSSGAPSTAPLGLTPSSTTAANLSLAPNVTNTVSNLAPNAANVVSSLAPSAADKALSLVSTAANAISNLGGNIGAATTAATKAGASIIPANIASIGGIQAYYDGKNSTPNLNLGDNIEMNLGTSTATSIYEPGTVPPVSNTPPSGDDVIIPPSQDNPTGGSNNIPPIQNKPTGGSNNIPPSQSKPSGGSNNILPSQSKPSGGNDIITPIRNNPSGGNDILSSSSVPPISPLPNTNPSPVENLSNNLNTSSDNLTSNSPIYGYDGSVLDRYNNSTVDSYNTNNYNTTTNNTTNNYYQNTNPNNSTQNNSSISSNKDTSGGISDAVIPTIIGLGVTGAVGAAGYSIYNKKKKEKEDEEEDE